MKSVLNFIKDFLNRSGSYVFLATIVSRIFSFGSSWIAIKLIPNKELGVVLFAFSIITFLLPFAGLGLQQGLIRFGAFLNSKEEKRNLFIEVLKKGILSSLFFVLITVLSCQFISFKYENTSFYIAALSVILIPTYILEIFKIYFRLNHNNKAFAILELIYNLILILSIFLLSYFYQEKGYIVALIISPIIAVLFFLNLIDLRLRFQKKTKIINFSFWKYGFFATLSNVVTQLLFAIDIIIIGILLNNSEMITNYKYLTLIPFSLLFIPRVFISTDFVKFTENIHDKKYITNYIKNYIKLFSLISVILGAILILFGKIILSVFDSVLADYVHLYYILTLGVMGIIILRSLFGNLLSSIGKAHVNFYIGSLALFINIIGNYYLIPTYGLIGAAITSSFVMWFTSIMSYLIFNNYYYKKA